jgi:PAS domain S-box-containing protein
MSASLQVLVLEDNPPDAELTVRALRASGMLLDWLRVDSADSFRHALQSRAWDVILADNSLPGFSATGALEILQELGYDIPFIVISGSLGEDLAVNLLRSGAEDFIIKGRLARLAPAVARAIREAGQRREKRQAEQAIRVLAERWQLLLSHAIDGVAFHEAIRDDRGRLTDFRYLDWNPAAARILGVAPDAVIGRTGREVSPDLLKPSLLERYARVISTGVSDLIEEYPVRQSPAEKVVDISCFRADAEHFVTLFRDVTERKLSRERLRQYALEVALFNQKLEKANAELERRNAELEEFAHIASHDLQEPLRKVVSFGDLLARALSDKLDARSAQYLRLMQEATRRLQTLIRDLLVMSRADRAPLHMEPTPLEDCVRVALDLLSARFDETGGVIEMDPLPTLTVDPAQICQLYQNLISNALKFSAAGTPPRIRLTCEAGADSPLLGVADNGIGIEPEYHEKIFEAFQRLHTRDRYEGSGIGLAVCRKIVSRHGGRIWVESAPGQGSHFRFTIPARPPAEDTTPAPPREHVDA